MYNIYFFKLNLQTINLYKLKIKKKYSYHGFTKIAD